MKQKTKLNVESFVYSKRCCSAFNFWVATNIGFTWQVSPLTPSARSCVPGGKAIGGGWLPRPLQAHACDWQLGTMAIVNRFTLSFLLGALSPVHWSSQTKLCTLNIFFRSEARIGWAQYHITYIYI